MTLGDALEFAKAGRRIRRMSEPTKVFYVDYTHRMNPYLTTESEEDEHMPEHLSNFEIFADDWEICDDG